MIRFLVLVLLPCLAWGEGVSVWQILKPEGALTVEAREDEQGRWWFPLASTVRFLGYGVEVCSRCGHDEVFAMGPTPPLVGGRLLVRWSQDTALWATLPGTLALDAAPRRIDGETWVSSQVFGFLGRVDVDQGARVLSFTPGVLEAHASPTPVPLLLAPVAAAGLLDGINPCVFTTLVFLVSYLAVAGRTRRQIFTLGVVYTLSVFVTYFLVGLGLFEAVRAAEAFPWLSAGLRVAVVVSLVVFAVLGLRDAFLAHRGRSHEMVLTLPGFFRDRVRAAVRSRVRAPLAAVAAASLGFLVTVFELVCTGQIYFPTIAYAVGVEKQVSALGFLAVYNVAFILPLAAVFGLTWWGMGSKALARWYQSHLAAARGLTAGLFLLLAALQLPGLV